jgi:hypothetical protein
MNKQTNEQPNNIQSNGLAFYTYWSIITVVDVYNPMDNKAALELVVDMVRPL